MLKLVVNNTGTEPESDSAFSNYFTCKDCVYYLSKSDSCSLQLAADSNSPLIPYECGNFEETYEIGTEDPLNSHIHQRLREEKVQMLAENYPAQPSINPIHKDVIWYGTANYGCWIVSDAKKRFALAEQVPFGDNNMSSEKYASPFPLHDHGAKEGIRNYMCWYVNEKGIGEYHILIGGVIMKIAEGVKKLGFNN
ncbi:hypothetical protein [Bacillus thuringiensis]|uniref:hypothetical protein n=1 Tax=Bacillus thuringiensis TaxID=1428 RepID=UPI001C466434|nr:hypothetical protein [Bacillus thuringiensis]MBV6681649.1 hypothetical protein [Bacillus thuringiensis]